MLRSGIMMLRARLLRRLLELVVGLDEVHTGERLMALEARGEIGLVVGRLVYIERPILPFAIAERVRIFGAPSGLLFHRIEAQEVAFDEAPVGTFDGLAVGIKLRCVSENRENGTA